MTDVISDQRCETVPSKTITSQLSDIYLEAGL